MSKHTGAQRIRTRTQAATARRVALVRRGERVEELLTLHNASGTTLGACTGSAALFVALGAVLSAANGDNLRAFLAFGTAITVAALMVAVVYCSNVIEISRIYPRSVVVWRGAKQRKRPVIQQRHGFSVKTYTIVRRRITWLGYGSLIALFVIYLCGLCMLVILVQ